MAEDTLSFWTDIQRYEDQLADDPSSYCFAPLAELYRKLGLVDDAITVAEKGCRLHPDYPGGFLVLGSAYAEKGESRQARQALERVLVLNPENLTALKLLGQIYVEQNETALAKRMFDRVLAQEPEDLETQLQLRTLHSDVEEAELEEVELLDEVFDEEEVEEPLQAPVEEIPSVSAAAISSAAPGDLLPEREAALFALELEQSFPSTSEELMTACGLGPAEAILRGEELLELEALGAAEDLDASEELEEVELLEEIVPLDELEELDLVEADDGFPVASIEPEPEPVGSATEPAPSSAAPPVSSLKKDPLVTATMAELYVSQGFLRRAVAVYCQLRDADPQNPAYEARIAELVRLQEAPPAPVPETQPPVDSSREETLNELSSWLDKIRSRRHGL